MRRLAVLAHFDAEGEVAPHVLRQVDALGRVADRLVVVSTAGLDPAGRAAADLRARAELVLRPNLGYDFCSWQAGLDAGGEATRYDSVVICNDSCVGPVVPYEQIFAAMRARPVDLWGLTRTARRGPHVQSFFVAFEPQVARSAAFTGFWTGLEPVSDRGEVITRYELGLSRVLREAGFRLGAYFEESAADRRLARARHLWFAAQRLRLLPAGQRRRALRRLPFERTNPMAALADRVLDGARLPVVKLDTLRYDPYGLGADRLLAACERRYPEQFDGVRDYLGRTAVRYPPRPGERPPGPVPAVVRHTIGYAR